MTRASFLAFILVPAFGATVDLHDATIVVRSGVLPNAEKTAAAVLVEEVEKRTGLRLPVSTVRPGNRPAIVITTGAAGMGAEGYRLSLNQSGPQPMIRIAGADARGALFGVGNLLRVAEMSNCWPSKSTGSTHATFTPPPSAMSEPGTERRFSHSTICVRFPKPIGS